MSEGLLKMWIALGAIGLMFFAVISITFSRMKLNGIFKLIVTLFAYVCMITAGILILFVVFSGPVPV
ncbi:DUF2768 domain-containing protein [Pseudalkalibacillus salsuginis]|uniref:DUF2768 domain-containing protein n=1 Tax=Pseudalkalibacillus salsuginis TaxID=2910972 RepID=UPI001CD61C3D|nr:DUF2768 domain-containing protein [Pseudalkalibacillus salsuginis]MCF6408239.1 DUF2768 domain-containing protein [Pseudalkalibacillus salsuginis]